TCCPSLRRPRWPGGPGGHPEPAGTQPPARCPAPPRPSSLPPPQPPSALTGWEGAAQKARAGGRGAARPTLPSPPPPPAPTPPPAPAPLRPLGGSVALTDCRAGGPGPPARAERRGAPRRPAPSRRAPSAAACPAAEHTKELAKSTSKSNEIKTVEYTLLV
ncbi:unnamed protein product, partial [Bubo scandiacus]